MARRESGEAKAAWVSFREEPGGRTPGSFICRNALQRSEEVQYVLLLRRGQGIEVELCGISFGAARIVVLNGHEQVGRAAVVQEEDPLPKSPQRRGAELVTAGAALRDVVRQPCSHVVNLEIAPLAE